VLETLLGAPRGWSRSSDRIVVGKATRKIRVWFAQRTAPRHVYAAGWRCLLTYLLTPRPDCLVLRPSTDSYLTPITGHRPPLRPVMSTVR